MRYNKFSINGKQAKPTSTEGWKANKQRGLAQHTSPLLSTCSLIWENPAWSHRKQGTVAPKLGQCYTWCPPRLCLEAPWGKGRHYHKCLSCHKSIILDDQWSQRFQFWPLFPDSEVILWRFPALVAPLLIGQCVVTHGTQRRVCSIYQAMTSPRATMQKHVLYCELGKYHLLLRSFLVSDLTPYITKQVLPEAQPPSRPAQSSNL